MTRGGYRAGKSSAKITKVAKRANMQVANRANMPSIPSSMPASQTVLPTSTSVVQKSVRTKAVDRSMPSVPTTVTQQSGATSIPSSVPTDQTLLPRSMPPVQTSGQSSTPVTPETSPVTNIQSNPVGQGTFTQSNPIGEGASNQSNTIGEGDSIGSRARTLVFLTSAGLEPSRDCSSFITNSFTSELDPNGINWKGVSNDVRDGYFGEFKKKFYWDSSISEVEMKKQWLAKTAKCYRYFISKIKRGRERPDFVSEDVWESWLRLWGSDECVKKSEINANNRRGGREAAAGTHTGGSITIGDHRKKLAVVLGRDPTPSELHLHVHTHDHDGKSFVGERSQLVHEKYEEILREKIESQSDIDKCEAYYEAAGGEKKRRIYGLGSEAKSYYGTTLCASSSVPPSVHQSTPISNLDELVRQLVPTLINHILLIVMERINGVQGVQTPIVPDPPTTTTDDEVDS